MFLQIKAGRIFDTLWVFLIKLALVAYEMIIANSYPTCTCARVTCCSKYMKGSGNLSFWLVQRPKWANTFILWSWKGQENVLLLWLFYSYFKEIAFTAVKRDEQFLTRYVKGVPFVNRRYMLQVKIKSRLKFFNLRWFTNSFVY